jgi:hypothetical protein
MHRFVPALALSALVVYAAPAQAQELHASGAADVVAGIEGGASGYASGIRRTRTMLRLGGEGYVDESPRHGLGIGALVELEPRASFGADLRYLFRFRELLVMHAGVTGILAPENMIGATFGCAYRMPLGKDLELNVNPLVNVYFLGNDLPTDTVIWQGMIAVGARFGLF